MIYLDNMAYHPVSPAVIKKTTELMHKLANPSSLHSAGVAMKKEIEEARANVAACIGCAPNEIIFTSGATESNQVMVGSTFSRCSLFEHSSISDLAFIMPFSHENIENELTHYAEHILIEGETGSNFKDYIVDNNIPYSDITAAIGNIPINVKSMKLKMASFSGEKIGGLSGTGVLYVSNEEYVDPLIEGHQENGRRGGTENIIGIVAMGIAIKEAVANMLIKNSHCANLKTILLQELRRNKLDFIVNGENQIPAICSVSFRGIEGAALANYLDAHGICVSTGSACNSGSMEPSKVLQAFGTPNEYINGTIRFSFGLQNTIAEIKHTASIIKQFMNSL